MILPKFVPGQIVITDTGKVGVIELGWDSGDDSYEYQLSKSDHIVGEESILYVLNGKIWLPAARYQPPVHAGGEPMTIQELKQDEDEAKWLAENLTPRHKVEVTYVE